jgi:vacuolar-type H+-ATPase subunit I/STV1
MQQHGGYQHFIDLMTESRIAHETIDNAIKTNEKRITAWGYLRKDISDLNRTRKVYNEYKALQKSTKFFAKRTVDKFYEKHEDEIRTHENALRDLKDYKRPLFTVKEIDEEIAKGKNANVENAKHYRAAKAEYARFTTIHRKLYDVNRIHKPQAPQKQKQHSQGLEK